MLIAIVPLIVLLVGILLWALATHPLVKEAGHDMFWTGLLVTLFTFASHTLRIG